MPIIALHRCEIGLSAADGYFGRDAPSASSRPAVRPSWDPLALPGCTAGLLRQWAPALMAGATQGAMTGGA
jgi:hypothetical protein